MGHLYASVNMWFSNNKTITRIYTDPFLALKQYARTVHSFVLIQSYTDHFALMQKCIFFTVHTTDTQYSFPTKNMPGESSYQS